MISASPSAQDVETYVKKHQVDILREYLGLAAIPDVRTDLPNIRKNAEYLRGMLERRNLHPQILETATTSVVYGEKLAAGATRTILLSMETGTRATQELVIWSSSDLVVAVASRRVTLQ